ncbi:MAG: hypothetical protein L3J13_05750 [Devosiaceae bacterium]|nr:hypothetical protein [Devosiaceae bacterium]
MKNLIFLPDRKKAKSIATAIAIGAFMLPVSTVSTKANDVGAELQHAIMCLGLLITDPVLHVEECGVSNSKVVNLNIASAGTHVVVQPEPEPEPEPEEDVQA